MTTRSLPLLVLCLVPPALFGSDGPQGRGACRPALDEAPHYESQRGSGPEGASSDDGKGLRLVTFRCDVTPPLGHPLCGGWIPPAREIVDRQWAKGIVLLPRDEKPIVLCAVDWCWIRGEAYDRWREALAGGAGTTRERVALHVVHPHDAPMADLEADRILEAAGCSERTLDHEFFEDVLERSASAVRVAMPRAREVTRVGTGVARVEKVGANRRIARKDGKVGPMRGSSCRDAALRAMPEGLIDPWLRCIRFAAGEETVAALYYYASHPMSYYGRGGVSSDFCGIARERLEEGLPGSTHVYFNGCGGDVAAGKYNDGAEENRPVLAARMQRAMKEAFQKARPGPEGRLGRVEWRVEPVLLPVREAYSREHFEALLEKEDGRAADRVKGAMGIAWWNRYEAERTIDVSCLRIGDVIVLHLPGEALIRWQLLAQRMVEAAHGGESLEVPEGMLTRPEDAPRAAGRPFLTVAAYGDCGPAYVPTAESYPLGGYEVSMAWVSPQADPLLRAALARLLAP